MRKFAAILLILIYTFNLVGYHVVFHLLETKAEQNLQVSLDNETYKETDLITLTTALNLPYVGDSPSFERVDGEITKDGKVYHFVKRAIRQGMLMLLCLPDREKMKLESSKGEFSKQAVDIQGPNSSKNNSDKKEDVYKSFRTKYLQAFMEEKNRLPLQVITALFCIDRSSPKKEPRHCPEQPPERC